MNGNILTLLRTGCPFLEVFQDMEELEGTVSKVPRLKVGHIRADYNGRRWWNTAWPCHPALATEDVKKEIDEIYVALTAKDALSDLDTLRQFCWSHPEACADREFQQEYHFYLEGTHCNFWIRLITRMRDYNIYLNAYAKSSAE